jgi:hypothetical protein
MRLTKNQILNVVDLPVKAVKVPEWGDRVVVHVRTLSGLEAEATKDMYKGDNFLGRYAALMISDEQGQRLFADEDAQALGAKNNDVLRRICEAAQELNGLTEEAHKETEKN